MAKTLEELRKKIDAVDNKLIDILNERMSVIHEIGAFKRTSNTVIYRPEREKSIIDRLYKNHRGLLNRAAIEAIFLEIFAISRNFELPELVAYLGPEGSFTHQAAESRFGAMSKYLALDSIRSVFEAVNTGRARFGVVPLENNQEGVVSETIDLLGSTELRITAEIPLPIHFAFATTCESISEVKRIYSKDIGFKQCKKFLRESFNGSRVEYIPVNSTSKAAKIAVEEKGSAAMCSHIAARMHNVPILFDNVEDSTDNFTRFLIISRDIKNQQSGHDKTSLLAKTTDKPGSLMMLLQDFYNAGINMSKLESRPAKKGKTFKYYFYIDIDGHIDDENIFTLFEKHKKDIKWLGSYVKMC
ncbi:MAG: prephenate dehydratase [Cytophagales bacterium]|nr:prephenate dehydratase [Cytophagales bacterium]